MRHEEQLRERIRTALQSRHATDSVRVTLAERDDARAEVARLRARIDAAAVVAANLIHEERCDWSGEPGREADCDCGVNTLRALLAFKENP